MGYLGDIERLRLRRYFQQRPVKFIVGLAVMGVCVYVLPTVDLHHQRRGKFFRDGYGGPFKSVCSREADRRGPHQNIIAYSIYGNFSAPGFANQYLRFLRETLNSVPLAYPGWVVRIYHNLTTDDTNGWKVLESAIDFGDHIDLCNATELIKQLKLADIFAMTWRWLPLLDDMVDSLMSRDTDSAILAREQDAVREWLASNRTFHIMRDHPKHRRFMLGCCWGVKVSQNRLKIANAARKMFHEDHRHEYDYDQKLLDRLLRPLATTSMMAHDSYSCEKFPNTKPYPTQRKDGLFVGGRKFQGVQLNIPCPLKCRPANATSEWIYC